MICSGTYKYTIVYTMSCQPRHMDTASWHKPAVGLSSPHFDHICLLDGIGCQISIASGNVQIFRPGFGYCLHSTA